MASIAIVGGGFSGTALVATLLRSSRGPLEILWFERSGSFGAGIAYGTDDPNHLLNVPADRMSAFRDEPSDFADWLVARGVVARSLVGQFFAPRRLYRIYLQELLAEAGPTVVRVAEEVVSLSKGVVETKSGGRFEADKIVLATGYLPESCFGSCLPTAFDPDRWPASGVREVTLIGSGLTAIDAALTAFERYPGVRVTAVSCHGKLPERFEFVSPELVDSGLPIPSGRQGFSWLRRQASRFGWHAVFASMRPRWEEVWGCSSPGEQRQFLRHLRHRYDALRHRMPPSSACAIADYREQGRFAVLSGTVFFADEKIVRYRSGGTESERKADLVVDCSGQSPYWKQSQDALASCLVAGRQVAPGPHEMGIVVSDRHEVITEEGPSSWLYALGPMLRGQRWETTAVAEIREQVGVLAEHLVD